MDLGRLHAREYCILLYNMNATPPFESRSLIERQISAMVLSRNRSIEASSCSDDQEEVSFVSMAHTYGKNSGIEPTVTMIRELRIDNSKGLIPKAMRIVTSNLEFIRA